MIFRNDDLSFTSSAWHFKRVNDLFKKYGLKHHVAVLFENLFDNYEVADLLVGEENIVVNWHGWSWKHLKYGEMPYEHIVGDMRKSIDYWNTIAKRRYNSDKKIERCYPTWHCISDDFKRASEDCGLIFDPRKELDEGVFVFHSWGYIRDEKFKQLEEWLIIHKERESQKPK